MRSVGIILALVGLLALISGRFTYTRHRESIDVAPLQAQVNERHTVAIPPVAGAIALLVGCALVVLDRRRF